VRVSTVTQPPAGTVKLVPSETFGTVVPLPPSAPSAVPSETPISKSRRKPPSLNVYVPDGAPPSTQTSTLPAFAKPALNIVELRGPDSALFDGAVIVFYELSVHAIITSPASAPAMIEPLVAFTTGLLKI